MNTPNCAYCAKQPEKVTPENVPHGQFREGSQEVFCATVGCPAFSNVVTLEVWNTRGPHEDAVKSIPQDEPIFVLRAQDGLALMAIYYWIDLAEKKKVNEEKLNKAVAHAEEFQKYQRTMPTGPKIPD